MIDEKPVHSRVLLALRRVLSLGLIFLLTEFFDELHYGIQGAALPVIRQDLALTYAQIGLLLGLPKIVGTLIEPFLMLLGDSNLRKKLIVGGGVVIALALLLIASAHSIIPLMIAFVISYPASGAFVTLSQATLMDLNPGREAQMMARWTVYGSLANLIGPALLAVVFALGLSWRLPYLGLAGFALCLALLIWRKPFPKRAAASAAIETEEHAASFKQTPSWMWHNIQHALQGRSLLRWVGLLEIADLMLDVLTSYLALYLADIVGLTPTQTGLALTLLMGTSLVADLALIPLLERFPGRRIVRISAALTIPLYVGFLLAPWIEVKLGLMIGLRLSTIGWYQVLQGEAYAAVPGRSGTVMAITSAAGIIGGALIWFIGISANQFGLPTAMWMLLAAPICLLIFTPRSKTG